MPALVQPLFDGPLDVVGDVHGEAAALDELLGCLGYGARGDHRVGRRLVFVGDLVDRGEDSPAVVERVAELVERGRAQMVVGNHELNLLLGERKEGNGWWFASDHDHDSEQGRFPAARAVTAARRDALEAWMRTLPLVLERDDLRVVHACWQDDAISRLRGVDTQVALAHRGFSDALDEYLVQSGLQDAREVELAQWGTLLSDPSTRPPLMPGVAQVDRVRQSKHPVKVVTSGLEEPTREPFFAAGKWRMSERVAWWHHYTDEPAVIVGHYWRWPEAQDGARARGPDLFAGHEPRAWLGPKRNVMCADWCAGLRWRERADGARRFEGRLGAVRWPEREIVWV